MTIKQAVARRIRKLCLERKLVINSLANICGLPPTTIYSILDHKSQNPGVTTIQKICDGLEMSIREFFNDPIFDNIEQEIK